MSQGLVLNHGQAQGGPADAPAPWGPQRLGLKGLHPWCGRPQVQAQPGCALPAALRWGTLKGHQHVSRTPRDCHRRQLEVRGWS